MNGSTRYSRFRPSGSTYPGNTRRELFDNRVFQLSNQVASGPVLTAVLGGEDSFDVNAARTQLGGANVDGKGVLNWGWSEFRWARHKNRCARSTVFTGIGLAPCGASEVPGFSDKFVLRATAKQAT